MGLQGDHQCMQIPDLFNFIRTQQFSGLLVIASANQERSFSFQRGELEYALINDPGNLIGEVIARDLQLDPAKIEQAVRTLSPLQFLGDSLIEQKLITNDQLRDVLGRQIRRALREVLKWKEWAFHFQQQFSDRAPPEVRICTQSLVLELAREHDEWNHICEIFADLQCRPVRVSGSVKMGNFPDWHPNLPPPGKVLLDIDGQSSLLKMLEESASPAFPLACAIARFVEEGLVHLIPPRREDDSKTERPTLILPVVPDLATRIMDAVPRATKPSDLQELIFCDPVLAARVLRLASLKSRGHTADRSLDFVEELNRIGLPALNTMLLAEATRRFYLSPLQFTWYSCWERCYLISLAASNIAELTGHSNPDMARLAGLLHEIGTLVLAAVSGQEYQEVLKELVSGRGSLLDLENNAFQTNHTRVGAMLAESWGFPAELKSVIRDHHSRLEHSSNKLLGIVKLAEYIADNLGATLRLSRAEKKIMRNLGIDAQDLEKVRGALLGQHHKLNTIGIEV